MMRRIRRNAITYTVTMGFLGVVYFLFTVYVLLYQDEVNHINLQPDEFERMVRSHPLQVDPKFLQKLDREDDEQVNQELQQDLEEALERIVKSNRDNNKVDQAHVKRDQKTPSHRFRRGGSKTGITPGKKERLDQDEGRKTPRPLLTLFTTMKSIAGREPMHANVLQNWASLGPEVALVLFSEPEDQSWARRAHMAGWQIRPVPRLKRGLPVLRAMYIDLIHNSTNKTPFYAYANSDILFDKSLVETLLALWQNYPKIAANALITGRRTNVDIRLIGEWKSHEQTARLKKRGEPGPENAEDYFITTPRGVPWDEVPELVIGRPGFDNWLVAKARGWKVTGVDASETVTALHQTGADGNEAGWRNAHDLCINRRLLTPFDYQPGFTHCLETVTGLDAAGDVVLLRRRDFPGTCVPDEGRAKDGARPGNPCP